MGALSPATLEAMITLMRWTLGSRVAGSALCQLLEDLARRRMDWRETAGVEGGTCVEVAEATAASTSERRYAAALSSSVVVSDTVGFDEAGDLGCASAKAAETIELICF